MKYSVQIEIVSGVEGKCLSIGNTQTSFRLAGPKPWGGGRTLHSFKVDYDELIAKAKEYKEAVKDG